MTEPIDPADFELLRLAVDLSPAGLLAIDEQDVILLVNREVEQLFGYSRDELLGQRIDMLVPARFRAAHPTHTRGYRDEPRARRMGIGRNLTGVRKDGTEVPVEIGLHPIRSARGLIVLASVVDISARARAEQRFHAAVESAPSGMVMIDEAGTIMLVNREVERLFGYGRDELIGRPVEILVPERFRAGHPSRRAGFYTDPHSRPMGAGRELFGLRKDGSEIAIEIGLNPIRTEDGIYVLSSIVDITTRRLVEGQLRQSQKMEAIGTLAGGIAHDFNNILLAIIGYTELSQAAAAPGSAQHTDLDQVLRAAERGRQLVQRILTFSRHGDVARQPISLQRSVREVLHLLRASLPTTIEIRESIEADTPTVLSDETQIHQVLMNLVTNAAHAMPSGGLLEVRVGRFQVTESFARSRPDLHVGSYARISIRDTGHGMSPEVLKRASEPFFTTKPQGMGTGLGLSVLHGIVRTHAGAIEIESRVNAGTRVDVYLPAHVAHGAAETAAEVPEQGGPHILIVDDEAPLVTMMKRQLEGRGYRVTAHTSSLEALDAFAQRPQTFDMLVTDNTMPNMTGLALAKEMLSLRPDLPILLTSGLADAQVAAQLGSGGSTAVLAKPHTGQQLAQAVAGLIGAPDGTLPRAR
jgi:PAS domain S-box-containing protein